MIQLSRQIDFEKPLSEADEQYLTERGQHSLVERLKARDAKRGAGKAEDAGTGGEEGPAKDPNAPEDEDWLDKWTVPQLKAKLDAEDIPYSGNAKKDDLKDLLYEFFEVQDED